MASWEKHQACYLGSLPCPAPPSTRSMQQYASFLPCPQSEIWVRVLCFLAAIKHSEFESQHFEAGLCLGDLWCSCVESLITRHHPSVTRQSLQILISYNETCFSTRFASSSHQLFENEYLIQIGVMRQLCMSNLLARYAQCVVIHYSGEAIWIEPNTWGFSAGI